MTLAGAPTNQDKEMFEQIGILRSSTNCYAYAVQDYGAGLIDSVESNLKFAFQDALTDFNYMPRPGQTTGKSYEELISLQPSQAPVWLEKRKKIMRRALKQDGILYQGTTYPEKVPSDKYVICCFLEPHSYHFIRQNQDGSWSSKNGASEVTDKANDMKTPLGNNPEIFYGNNPDYPFVGYFFVPKGGVRIGLKRFLSKLPRLNKMQLMQALQKQGNQEGRNLVTKENMANTQKHITSILSVFSEVYQDIETMRDMFRTQTKPVNFDAAYEKVHQIKRKLSLANSHKIIELRSFLKKKQEVSPTCRAKILKNVQR